MTRRDLLGPLDSPSPWGCAVAAAMLLALAFASFAAVMRDYYSLDVPGL